MLRTRKVRSLHIRQPADASRAAHLSAASGLVRAGRFLYVVADDENHLGRFVSGEKSPGELIRLLPGALPAGAKARKAAKADFEALVLLPAFGRFTCGALFAMGSGSRPNRQTGVLLGLDALGSVNTAPMRFDLAALYDGLRGIVGELNIEGAVVLGPTLRLLQRGNKGAVNRLIDFPLAPLLTALAARRPVRIELPVTQRVYDLGKVQGVPLGFSDGAALPEGAMVFTAIAEDTDNAYDDGGCVGSSVGIIGADGDIVRIEPLDRPLKVEGIDARVDTRGKRAKRSRIRLRLVTDGDDASQAAQLVAAELKLV